MVNRFLFGISFLGLNNQKTRQYNSRKFPFAKQSKMHDGDNYRRLVEIVRWKSHSHFEYLPKI